MSPGAVALLSASTLAFVCAGAAAKAWTLSQGSVVWLAATLGLYTIGNLIMLRLIREVGMGVALSLSAVVQLIAVNVVAVVFFDEHVTTMQAAGIVLAVASVALITLSPSG